MAKSVLKYSFRFLFNDLSIKSKVATREIAIP